MNIMSSEKQQINTGEAGLIPFVGCTGSSNSFVIAESAPKRTLRQLIENELVGVPLRDQINALNLLLSRLMGNASHLNKI
jgi:hypothetical protein